MIIEKPVITGGIISSGFSTITHGVFTRRHTAHYKRASEKLRRYGRVILCGTVHENMICDVDEDIVCGSKIIARGCDSITTQLPGVCLGLCCADCVPLFIVSKDRISLVHVGWRGCINGIIKRSLDFYEDKESVRVWMGPHIRDCCFDVGTQVVDQFFNYSESSVKPGNFISMEDVICQQLCSCGVKSTSIYSCNKCTKCNGDDLCSRRREPESKDHNVAFIVIDR